ncbi:MAG: ABC transporter permease [Candidatus Aminicenantes bacterium]|nr:ABC transporter permease [Candidatus Aminicenantes bacterium]
MRNFFSITIICLTFLTVGVFLALANNLEHVAEQISNNMAAVFFLDTDISEEQLNAVEEELKRSQLVLETTFVSAEQAVDKFREKFPELQGIIENIKINPFPPSIETTFKEKTITFREASGLITQIKNMPGVEDVQFNQEWVDRVNSFSRLAKAVGFFLGGILVLASFFIISNVIRLNVFARKDEIEILRLVGATNTFIRVPFLLEGITLGVIGGLVSLFLLLLLINSIPIYLGSRPGVLNELINFRYLTLSQSITIIAEGGVIGFLGSLTSLARFLKT